MCISKLIAGLVVIAVGTSPLSYQARAHDAEGLMAMRAQEAQLPLDVQAALAQREALRDHALMGAAPASHVPGSQQGPPPNANAVAAPPSGSTLEQLADARAKWAQRDVLTVCFFDGSAIARHQFMGIFKELLQYTNLSVGDQEIDCGTGSARIRVSFRQPGYWSYIGTDALYIPPAMPTLNLYGMGSDAIWTESQKGVARHEDCHALACLHEHQHPDVMCNWRPYEDIATLLGWPLNEVKNNFDQIKAVPGIVVTPYDQKSIMHYQLSAQFFQDGKKDNCYISSQNTQLDDGDKAILSQLYPKGK